MRVSLRWTRLTQGMDGESTFGARPRPVLMHFLRDASSTGRDRVFGGKGLAIEFFIVGVEKD